MNLAMDIEDKVLRYVTKRKWRKLTAKQVIAINLLWRDGEKIRTLAKVFNVSPNTIYYKCCTGDADSYPRTQTNSAADTNDLIEELGVEEAKRRFITPEIKDALRKAKRLEEQ